MTIWSGKKDSGERTYDAHQQQVVRRDILGHVGAVAATQIEAISQRTNVPARTTRAILSDMDGDGLVFAYTDDMMVFIAEWQEEAEGYTRKLAAQVRTMSDRLDARRRMQAKLPRRQLGMDL